MLTVTPKEGSQNFRGIHDFQKFIQKFHSRERDISLWLVLFKRHTEPEQIPKEDWVSHLLGLLPYGFPQLIAKDEDYDHIKVAT